MYTLAILSPLIGFLVITLLGRWMNPKVSGGVACAFMMVSTLWAWVIFKEVALEGEHVSVLLGEWVSLKTFQAPWVLRFDSLSATMIMVVTTVSSLVHVYSLGYMAQDEGLARFMAYLSLFTFLMLMLVTADNLVQLFFGWEGVGLASYLLIGFWHHKPSANQASVKAFIVNRVGDMAFVLGIGTLLSAFHTLQFDQIFSQIPQVRELSYSFFGQEVSLLTVAAFLFFLGAMGKSAQLGLHVWLPDAMEGPTPVSALIHAATMVTAGVFLVSRLSPLFEYAPSVLNFMTFIGATTAFFAASIGMVQNDLKRVIAYSTCSQLGYMFFAAGISAYDASIFHLVTHAFFKALLFLGAGSVIHAMSEEQNIQKMGGLMTSIPTTYFLMVLGSLALCGIPGLSGYYSKDLILERAWQLGGSFGTYAFWMGLITAFLTSFYTARLLFLVFHGKSHAMERVQAHVHESPFVMLLPMGVLGVGATVCGVLFKKWMEEPSFWGHSLFFLKEESLTPLPLWVTWSPTGVALGGIGLAVVCYLLKPQIPAFFCFRFKKLYSFLSHKWYVDDLYEKCFVAPTYGGAQFFGRVMDPQIIDRGGPYFITQVMIKVSSLLGRLQRGSLYYDLMMMVLGLLVIILICFYQGVL